MSRLAQALEAQTQDGRCILLITHDLELLARMGRHALRLPLPPSLRATGGQGERTDTQEAVTTAA